jgi:hypothetical protein
MARTFISHSHKDRYFVTLLDHLLDYHGVEAWCSSRHLIGGEAFNDAIQKALAKAESLLVVVSRNSVGSQWIVREASAFRTSQPAARIVPILLDDSDPRGVFDPLAQYHAVDFSGDMKVGFEHLLRVFGRAFLAKTEHRSGSNRRILTNRASDDRRQALPVQRLRRGFWKAFASETGIEKQAPLDLTRTQCFRTVKALLPEAKRYTFVSDDTAVTAEQALKTAASEVWDELQEQGELPAVHAVEAVAERLERRFDPRPVDRRKNERRADEPRREREAAVRVP